MDSDADKECIDSNVVPDIEVMMRDVTVLELAMKIETFNSKSAYGIKSGILQINAQGKDKSWMPLAMSVIFAPGTGNNLFSTTQAAEKGVFTPSKRKNGQIPKQGTYG